MIVEVPAELEAALMTKAEALGLSVSDFALETLQREASTDPKSREPGLKTGYGMWAKYGVSISDEDIAENRKEMFAGWDDKFADIGSR